MSANLDINAGVASFVSAREHAWHQLGEVADGAMTAAEALRKGRLAGWNLRKEPIFAHVGDQQVRVPDRYAVVRDNPVIPGQVDVLGDVKARYSIIHPEQLTDLLDTIVEESGAHYETAGALDGGRKVFVTMKLPGHIRVGGVDQVDLYVAAVTSFDGGTATCLMPTPVRIVCANTLNLAFKQATSVYKVRHTVGAHKILVQQAREGMGFTFDYLDGFQEQAEQLINTTLTQSKFEQIIQAEFGVDKDSAPSTLTRVQKKLDTMAMLFADAGTQEGIRNTAWAGLNALTEWYDHFSPVRGAGDAEGEITARNQRTLLYPEFKNQALDAMMALV